jgi:superfamily II DNA helicase RecQ
MKTLSAHSELLERLVRWRREEAVRRGVPAFTVFHDAVLAELADSRPTTSDALLAVRGIGPAKLATYGERLLELLAEPVTS